MTAGWQVGSQVSLTVKAGLGVVPEDAPAWSLSPWPNLMPDLMPRRTLTFQKLCCEHLDLPHFYRGGKQGIEGCHIWQCMPNHRWSASLTRPLLQRAPDIPVPF